MILFNNVFIKIEVSWRRREVDDNKNTCRPILFNILTLLKFKGTVHQQTKPVCVSVCPFIFYSASLRRGTR